MALQLGLIQGKIGERQNLLLSGRKWAFLSEEMIIIHIQRRLMLLLFQMPVNE
jgi:hypothetical protein